VVRSWFPACLQLWLAQGSRSLILSAFSLESFKIPLFTDLGRLTHLDVGYGHISLPSSGEERQS
jgi:hypothetical protein